MKKSHKIIFYPTTVLCPSNIELQKLKLKLKKDYGKQDIKTLNKVECQY